MLDTPVDDASVNCTSRRMTHRRCCIIVLTCPPQSSCSLQGSAAGCESEMLLQVAG